MLNFFKFLTGLAGLPLAVALTQAFLMQLTDEAGITRLDRNGFWFMGGFGIWLILFFMFPKPVRTYVLAHELTHALWGLLMGARVSRLRVTGKGGSVTLSKSNVLITLAPYFFPFYAVLALVTYLLVEIWHDTSAYLPFWYAVFGLTWSFHVCFTVSTLAVRQPDIQEHGRVFSYVLIYCINLATAALLLSLLTNRPAADLGDSIWRTTRDAYLATGTGVQAGFRQASAWLNDRYNK